MTITTATKHDDDVVATMSVNDRPGRSVDVSRRLFDTILTGTSPFDWFKGTGSVDAAAMSGALRQRIPDTWSDIVSTVKLIMLLRGLDWLATVQIAYHDPDLRARIGDLYTDDEQHQRVVQASNYLQTHSRGAW